MSKHFPLLPLLISLLLLAWPGRQAEAQILNVEKSRLEKDTANFWLGNIGLNLGMFNRNAGSSVPTHYLNFTGNADIAYLSQKHSYMLFNYANYLFIKNDPIVRTGYSHFRMNFLRKRQLSYEAFSQYQYDLGRGLDLRLLGAIGMRLRVFKTKKNTMYAGTGAMYEHEEWKNPDDELHTSVTDFIKSTNYLSIRTRFNDKVEGNLISYYQIGYDETISNFRPRLSGELNLMFTIWSGLKFTTNFSCSYDKRPIVPITPFIYAINNGIRWTF